MARLTSQQRLILSQKLLRRAAVDQELTEEQQAELRRHAENLCAVDGLEARMQHANHAGLLCIFDQASIRSWLEDLRYELGYSHMMHLADVFEGWAFERRLTPNRTAKLAEWADAIRDLAATVGADWAPPIPVRRISIIGFLGLMLRGE